MPLFKCNYYTSKIDLNGVLLLLLRPPPQAGYARLSASGGAAGVEHHFGAIFSGNNCILKRGITIITPRAALIQKWPYLMMITTRVAPWRDVMSQL